MHMNHKLQKADVIFVLGSRDVRVAEYAARLYLDGWAPVILFSGSGDIHNHEPGREKFVGTTEAEVFANIAQEKGVPKASIFIENKSQNTGENYMFSKSILEENGMHPRTIIAVQKPYVERRVYATGKVHWPDIEIIVTSPPISVEEYSNETNSHNEHWVHSMVGDLQRIKEYPAKGFQIEQNIPDDVWKAYEYLVGEGYTNCLL